MIFNILSVQLFFLEKGKSLINYVCIISSFQYPLLFRHRWKKPPLGLEIPRVDRQPLDVGSWRCLPCAWQFPCATETPWGWGSSPGLTLGMQRKEVPPPLLTSLLLDAGVGLCPSEKITTNRILCLCGPDPSQSLRYLNLSMVVPASLPQLLGIPNREGQSYLATVNLRIHRSLSSLSLPVF